MSSIKNEILANHLNDGDKAAKHLVYSLDKSISLVNKSHYSESELETLEALTARFERLTDVIIYKLLRSIDYLDYDKSPTIRHVLVKAEKKGIVENQDLFLEIRELRNIIAHDYVGEKINEIHLTQLGFL